jgi:ribonuclease Z
MKEILNTLELVWISHNHADHHLGLLHVLSLREPKMNPLYILGPTPLQYWLKEYSKLDPNIALKYIFVDNLCFVQAKEIDPMMLNKAKILSNLKDFIGLDQIECIEVKHCHLSYAGVFVFTNGFKIAFSGDCRPSDAFAKKAFDADILIHEATFENAMQQEAIFKNHCTIEEAIQIGQQANAKHILLTHFSQRYPKIPPLLSTELEKKVMIAFDLLSLPLNKLLVPQLMEICPLLMAKDDDVDEEEQDN